MNSSVYVFGRLGSNYTQYPDDYTQNIYQAFYEKSTAVSQIVIHRSNNLIYYGYIRKLDSEGDYLGFCILLNDLMLSNVKRLFPIFENAITNLVGRGDIIGFDDEGNIVPVAGNLSERQKEVEQTAALLRSDVEALEKGAKKLPPVSYAIAKDESISFSVNDKDSSILEASAKYGYTCILKPEDYDTASLTSYRSTIKRLYEENERLTQQYNTLKEEHDALNKQKKQYKKVVFFIVLTIVLGLGVFLLTSVLSDTQESLTTAQEDINRKELAIENLNSNVNTLQGNLLYERDRRKQIELDYTTLKSELVNYAPIIIKDIELANVYGNGDIETEPGKTIYSGYTMYLKPQISYIGINTGEEITLTVKLYVQGYNSDMYTWKETFLIENTEKPLYLSPKGSSRMGYWPSGEYLYEFWYGNLCLGSKTFVIH